MSDHLPETSIVIRAFNEERWLPSVFEALSRQRYRDFEVLLVDSGSVDRTREIAASNGARIVKLRSEDFTFGYSLNIGIAEARGSLIAIISAHAIPSDENWLERLIAPLRREEVAMVYGGQRGHPISKFAETRDFVRMFPGRPHTVDAEEPFANNANSAVKKDLWSLHRFDEGLPGLEDIEWAKHWLTEGKQVLYQPDACIIHVHTESWQQVRRRYHREGMAARWVGLKILRHIPGEVLRELMWCAEDLLSAAVKGRFTALCMEVLRFRYEKLVGTVSGITDSRGLDSPGQRAEMYFRKGFPALVIKGPNRIELEDRAVPSLKPGEILVRVSHIGISGSDLDIIDGKASGGLADPARRSTAPGRELCGVVVSLGPRVTELAEGDHVVVESAPGCGECSACKADDSIRCSAEKRETHDGSWAAYVVTRARHAHRIPADVSLATAALTASVALVCKGLRRIGAMPSSISCAVVGGDALGFVASQVLASRGYAVKLLDYNKHLTTRDHGGATRPFGDLRNFQLVVDATGRHDVLSAVLQNTAPEATILLLGQTYSNHSLSLDSIVAGDRTIVGSIGSSRRDFAEALNSLRDIDLSALLQNVYPLEQYEQALTVARSRATLKVMLTPAPSAS